MHQIYSCSDENLEVFTTVISSKSCSPARRKAKSTQHILTKRVVAVSDYRTYWTEDLLPSQGDLTQVLYKDAVRNFGRLQNEQEGFCPAKHMGISEQESSKSCDNQSDGKSSQPSTSPVTHIIVKRAAATEPATQDIASAEEKSGLQGWMWASFEKRLACLCHECIEPTAIEIEGGGGSLVGPDKSALFSILLLLARAGVVSFPSAELPGHCDKGSQAESLLAELNCQGRTVP
ncbi:vexin [Terrapene carolina triunguis]|uniref:vexin n=1 Tax=Terrapene triunguis TaxID=2587831 RepID=UPI001156835A|nr:vexin [Terrapene carolina triunguis]